MKAGYSLLLILLFLIPDSKAQDVKVIDPPFWWANMPVTELQIQLYGENIGSYRASVNYDGVEIKRQIAVDSPNYLFIYLDISEKAEVGKLDIILKNGDKSITVPYELLEREPAEGRYQGFDSRDVIYLMMPDRFANGNPDNDTIEGMLESADRSNPQRRQGGDIQGVVENLDYIKDLGVSAVWFTPLFENDMTTKYGAYHGYAATDLYKVDRRFGSNEEYKAMIETVHENGMKVIMDMIHNHIGDQHWWMKDLPTKDWVHDFEKLGQTNFRGSVASDPYASEFDSRKLVDGWFVPEMPDLNQDNELLTDYLIQNTLWWIEYTGVDGIRMDTYVYPDKDYMARWSKEVLEAYPTFNIVGEAWVNTVAGEAYWQEDKDGVDDGYDSELPSLTDFQFAFAVRKAFNEDFGWTEGLSQLYYVLSQDFLYSDPMKNVTFLDNHDMSRFFEHIGKREAEFKMALAWLMTTRGTPQIYYGTELLMGHENRGGDDEVWRQTMPGGFPNDSRSVFTREGRTQKENEIHEYTKKLIHWRNSSPAIHEGKLVHFIPQDNVYVYFRVHKDQTVMVVMNNSEENKTMERLRFAEILDQFKTGQNVMNNKTIDLSDNFSVDAKKTVILELR
ncbi:MAG: glycoside hydrolase family 13 protein [Balneola sp.]|nr:glycoside hydrolase family 13 protein [Balneola sp.]MBO6650584.1 glycoside hydrolase family 13 protein [Balneola sp.]MBO6712637.1 glycoside hydrolase family 13 protein [Balneola sp.]MBO6800869.1 glycoside hydrolase family 13 protein [Balneola sp.]MBO6870542.1 glycoside hydrolase family 13 protein [Balneola sp.]